MQDWHYEVANAADIGAYIKYYKSEVDNDKKALLMQAIIQSTENQECQADFESYWRILEPLLRTDFKLHAYAVFYWSCFDIKDLNDC